MVKADNVVALPAVQSYRRLHTGLHRRLYVYSVGCVNLLCIHIVGGGSNADYLNKLTAEATGLTVYAGPGEATAIGNLAGGSGNHTLLHSPDCLPCSQENSLPPSAPSP